MAGAQGGASARSKKLRATPGACSGGEEPRKPQRLTSSTTTPCTHSPQAGRLQRDRRWAKAPPTLLCRHAFCFGCVCMAQPRPPPAPPTLRAVAQEVQRQALCLQVPSVRQKGHPSSAAVRRHGRGRGAGGPAEPLRLAAGRSQRCVHARTGRLRPRAGSRRPPRRSSNKRPPIVLFRDIYGGLLTAAHNNALGSRHALSRSPSSQPSMSSRS